MKSAGWPIIIILTTIPIVIWSLMMPLTSRFGNLSLSTTSLGQLLGLCGMTLFSIAMMLSTRLKIFDTLFNGLNRAYIVHHQVGGIAFILLMIHPLTLSISYLIISVKNAALFLFPGQDWINNFGIAGLLTIMGLLILTYYVDLPYELWRFTHKFMGIGFLFGVTHAFFIPSDISSNPILRVYMVCLMGAGLVGYFYRTVFGRWLVPRLPYTVLSVEKKGEVTQLTLIPSSTKVLHFLPGQFMFIQFIKNGIRQETHPFSISSAPDPKKFQISAKAIGDFTVDLPNITSGTKALVEGPFGRFSLVYTPSQKYVWIAGGIGITPFLSMARSLDNTSDITLFYVIREEKEAVFLSELIELSKKNSKFKVIPWYTTVSGHLDGDSIKNYVSNAEIFICGPPAMMKAMKTELKHFGVNSQRIHSEEFSIN